MKYRSLTDVELQGMEDDFIRFLAANTITADDWVKIKKDEIEKATQLIEMYSDLVFDKVLKDVKYLEFRSPKDLKIFECLENSIKLRGIKINGPTEFEFTNSNRPENWTEQLLSSDTKIEVYKAEKAYSQVREKEIFRMMENGCLISKEEMLFKTIDGLSS